MERWEPDKRYKGTPGNFGVFGDFCVLGIKHYGPLGKVGWLITSWQQKWSWQNGDRKHEYWILDLTFSQNGGRVENMTPAERDAIKVAIEFWKTPKINSVRRLSAATH
jgi:hypothetical protein